MNYIYDITLNFNNCFYDFFEWNKNDKICHIKRICSIKVSSKMLNDLRYNKVKVDKSFLMKIFNKSEEYRYNRSYKLKYVCLFGDEKDVIAVSFNKDGINDMVSSLPIDEQLDIIDILKYHKSFNYKYIIIKKETIDFFKTRFEKSNEDFINNELLKMWKTKDIKKLNYICLECFGKKGFSVDCAVKTIKKEIINSSDNFKKIFNILKIANQK